MWPGNARKYEFLDESSCKGLLDSIRQFGGNFVPASVRSVADGEVDYEVMAGVRRLWCVRLLRSRGFDDIRYRVIVEEGHSELSIFKLTDAENRLRLDLSAYERALGYSYALKHVFAGGLQALSMDTGVSDRALRRLLLLGQLPRGVVDAYGDPRRLTQNHGARLTGALNVSRKAVLREAEVLTREQRARVQDSRPFMSVREVTTRLVSAAADTRVQAVSVGPVFGATGQTLVSGRYDRARGWNLRLPAPAHGETVDHYVEAVRRALTDSFPTE